jgi:hypothetical protein
VLGELFEWLDVVQLYVAGHPMDGVELVLEESLEGASVEGAVAGPAGGVEKRVEQ